MTRCRHEVLHRKSTLLQMMAAWAGLLCRAPVVLLGTAKTGERGADCELRGRHRRQRGRHRSDTNADIALTQRNTTRQTRVGQRHCQRTEKLRFNRRSLRRQQKQKSKLSSQSLA
ncbi:unnamed protein product, partial [Nesidiocoris tenuis]